MANGAIAVIEDTWTADRGFWFNRTELFGTAGAIIDDTTRSGKIALRGNFGFDTWVDLAARSAAQPTPIDHMVDIVRGESAPVATIDDARANLAACLAFYQAARAGTRVEIRD
jgi:predicted dehydrogenase